MDRRRAAAALLALAACIACSSAAPTASNPTALELHEGPTEGCYYNFQHYGEGDRIMTNEPCLNCTCHNRMLMCYLRVCPFTKPIGQDCTVEKRADQCCPIVTCPDVPVDLLTSTSTSSPAEYGSTGIGKHDKYGCSINGKYFSEGSKVPSTPNKPCEHCYCIRNMTTCVMQECTLHVDGCTPIYHKEVCCPVRYSCDHPEDEIPLLDDMTTTVRPTPGFLLTTTTAVMPVTQMTQDCVHDDQIFPDGALIKTEKACEHCYCMKGDIVCVVQECGTPMENEGKNCTSLPPRHGQCCPDTYICDGDDRGTDTTTELDDQPTPPPRRAGVEGSGYRNEPDEPFTEISPYETDIEGSGEDYATAIPTGTVEDIITEKVSPDLIDELLATTDKVQTNLSTEPDRGQNTIPDVILEKEGSILSTYDATTDSSEQNTVLTTASLPSITITEEVKPVDELVPKEEEFITTEAAFRKEDNNIVPDEILTVKEPEKLSTLINLIDTTTSKYVPSIGESTDTNVHPEHHSTPSSIEQPTEDVDAQKERPTEDKSQLSTTERISSDEESTKATEEETYVTTTAKMIEKTDVLETTSVNPVINEVDENLLPPGRIPGEGDCLLNGITYTNNTIVPSTNNCHTSCKCTSSIIKCDPIICSPPPEYMENMNDCQPIYDSPDACCPTYVCSGKETIPPESHSQMSGTEIPKTSSPSECNGNECILDERQKPIHDLTSGCTSDDCLNKPIEKQEQSDCGSNDCTHIDHTQTQSSEPSQGCSGDECQVLPVVACEGDQCKTKPIIDSDSHKIPGLEDVPAIVCDEKLGCKKAEDTKPEECKDELCRRKDTHELEVKVPSECSGSECKADIPILPTLEQEQDQFTGSKTEEIPKDTVTEASLAELDMEHTALPISKISTTTDEHVTEQATPHVTEKMEIYTESPEEMTTMSKTSTEPHTTGDQSDRTVPSIIEGGFEEGFRNPERDSTDTPVATKVTEKTSYEDRLYATSPGLIDNKDLITTVSQQTSEKDQSSEEPAESEELFTEKVQITTEKLNIDIDDKTDVSIDGGGSTKVPELSQVDITHTKIPEMALTEFEKSTKADHFLGSTEKESTYEDITEISVIKDQQPTITSIKDTITQQTEIPTNELNKYVTKQPTSEFVETHTETSEEKYTKQQQTDEAYETVTDKTGGEISYVTQLPDSHITKDETVTIDDTETITEPNAIHTQTSSPILTNIEEVTKEITQENVTEKKELYTEPNIIQTDIPQSINVIIDEAKEKEENEIMTETHKTVTETSVDSTTKAVEMDDDAQKTTAVPSAYLTDSIYITEMPEEPITEKKTYTESPQTLQTGINEISEAIGTERDTIYPEIKEHLSTTLGETMTSTSTEKHKDISVTEEQSTKAFESATTKDKSYTETPERESTSAYESDITVKEEMYTETPTNNITPSEEFITEDFDKTKQDVITELPEYHKTSEAEIITTTKEISKDSEKPTTIKKEPYVPEEAIYTTSDTAKITEQITEKIGVTVPEYSTSQGLKEDFDIQATSAPISEDKQDLEYHKITTALPDVVIVQETTTVQNPIEMTESETKNPLRIDEKPEELLTEIPEKLPSEADEISTDTIVQSLHTTERYATETPKIKVTEGTVHEDSSTKSPVNQDIPVDIGKPQEETEENIEATTSISQDSEHISMPQIEITSEDIDKTTSHSIYHEDKESSHVTESFTGIEIEDTQKEVTIGDSTVDDDILRQITTDKSIFEEHLPQTGHEYTPVEAVSEEVTTQTAKHLSTEKVHIPDIFETNLPDITTKQPEEFTRFEESGTSSILGDKEHEIITNIPESYTPSPELHEISTPKQSDQFDTNVQSEIDDNKQIVTTPTDIPSKEDKKITETPISLITNKERVTIPETLITIKDETELESITKKYGDQTTEVAKEQLITSKEFTTEQHPLFTEVPKDMFTQHQEITTDKITTGVPESMTVSYVHKTTLSPLEEDAKTDKVDITTEKQLHLKESDIKPLPDSSIQTTDGTLIDEELSILDEQKTTLKPLDHNEELAPHLPEYQTTVLVDEIETETPHKQITTLSPKLGSGDESEKVTEMIEMVDHEYTTKHAPLDHHETVTGEVELEKSPEIYKTESNLDTATSKPSITEQNEVDTVPYPSKDTVLTKGDEPTVTITESVEAVRTDKPTEIVTESMEDTRTDKPSEIITELIDHVHTDKPTEMITKSIEDAHTDKPSEMITESVEDVRTDKPTEIITASVEDGRTDKPIEIITESIEDIRTNKPTEIITESVEDVRTDKPTEIITQSIENVHTDKPIEIITESVEDDRTVKPTEIIKETIEDIRTDKPIEFVTEPIEDVRTDKPTGMITESIEEVRTDKPTEMITKLVEDIRTDKPIEIVTEPIEDVRTDKPTGMITESIEEVRTDKPTEMITESVEDVRTDKPIERITESVEDVRTDKPIEIITESVEDVRTDKPVEIITELIQMSHTDKPTEMITDSIETVNTDKAVPMISESVEPVEPIIADQTRKTTAIPIYTESLDTSTIAIEEISEKHETLETDSPKEYIPTTVSQYVTVGVVQEDSSTEGIHVGHEEPDQIVTDKELVTPGIDVTEITITKEDSETEKVQLTDVSSTSETTDSNIENQTKLLDKDDTSVTKVTDIHVESHTPSLPEKEDEDTSILHTTSAVQEPVTQKEVDKTISEDTSTPGIISYPELSESTEKQSVPDTVNESYQTTESQHKYTKTTPFLIELEEHTHHVIDEITTRAPLEEIITTIKYDIQQPERGDQIPDDFDTHKDEYQTSEASKTTAQVSEDEEKPETPIKVHVDETTIVPAKTETDISVLVEKTPDPTSIYTKLDDVNKDESTLHDEKTTASIASQISQEKEYTTESTIQETSSSSQADKQPTTEKNIYIESDKPSQPDIPEEKLTSETIKETTSKISEETSTYSPSIIDKTTKPEERPIDTTSPQSITEASKPGFIDEPIEEVPSPDFPPSGGGGYGQETDYVDEDQAFGPGTCRYGGKVYVSAQQIPRDDPCDFCFCFRSDIICLQQSCPPPIHGCHEEPIQGFCCPRYECPVSMATTLNVTTTTTTTTTTLPPHFLPHAYKGAAQRRGCQIKGHTYKVGEVVRASSGPCLHCTCGGDGQMKCDPKACTPEPMLRQMIAAAVSAKRRR